MQCRRGIAVDADITVGAVGTQMTAPEVRRMAWQQTGVDAEETRQQLRAGVGMQASCMSLDYTTPSQASANMF